MRSFIKISSSVFNLQQSGHEYMVEMAMFNVNRTITPKVDKQELRFIYPTRCLIVLYICLKFRENILNGFQLTERTRVRGRNGYVQCSKGINSKSRQTRITVHVCCMSSHSVLHFVKFGKNISESDKGKINNNNSLRREVTCSFLLCCDVWLTTYKKYRLFM